MLCGFSGMSGSASSNRLLTNQEGASILTVKAPSEAPLQQTEQVSMFRTSQASDQPQAHVAKYLKAYLPLQSSEASQTQAQQARKQPCILPRV